MLNKIELQDMTENFTALMRERWALLTASGQQVNPMTVGWAQMGILWERPVCTAYVRPQRHTFGLMNDGDYFSLSFLPARLHDAMVLCGSKSGRDMDKVQAAGLTAVTDRNAPYYAESELVILCRKLYQQDIEPQHFVDPAVDPKWYAKRDYHRMYVGEIEEILRKG